MLFTDTFTYIHEPKTGGTFVTHALKRIHGGLVDVRPTRTRGPVLRRLGLDSLVFDAERMRTPEPQGASVTRYGVLYNWNDHGTCSEIPRRFRRRQILATARSPFETYVSLYLFGWWRRPDAVERYERMVADLDRRFPRFPELSFAEFMDLLGIEAGGGPGFLTQRFVTYYFRRPQKALGVIDDSYIESCRYRDDMHQVRFLHTTRLNEELYELLIEFGYDRADIGFITEMKHVIPVGGTKVALAERATSHDWADYYTPELEAAVRDRDKLMFAIFPEFAAASVTS